MTWIVTTEQQIEALEDDIARIDRELAHVPSRVLDWPGYWCRIDRLRRDRMSLSFDLRRLRAQHRKEEAAAA